MSEPYEVYVPELLTALGLCHSRSEARRLLCQGAVSIGERQLRAEDDHLTLEVEPGEVVPVSVGRKRGSARRL